MNISMGNVFQRAKIVLVANSKCDLSRGKLAILGARATIKSYKQSSHLDRTKFFLNGQLKVTLKSNINCTLSSYYAEALDKKLNCYLVEDEKGCETILAIGPNNVNDIDSITGSLKLAN